MRSRIAIMSLLILALSLPCMANLVKNPGFEEGAGADGLPAGGWWVWTGEGKALISVDSAVAHTGKASVKLSAEAPSKFTSVSGPIPVTPFDDMRFEGFVRVQDLKGGKNPVSFALSFRDAGGKIVARNYVYPDKPLSGNWTKLGGTATVPVGAVTGEIFLQFNSATGTAWFDSISAVTTNLVSLGLADSANPFIGEQTITALVENHGDSQFAGTLKLTMGKQVSEVPVSVGARSGLRVPLSINMKAAGNYDYTLDLLRASGESERKITGRFMADPPLTVYAACPCYHAIGEGDGTTKLAVRVNLHPSRLPGAHLQVEVANTAGTKMQKADVDVSRGGLVEVALKLPVDKTDDFLATMKLLDSGGTEVGSGQADIHVRPRSESQVVMNADGYPLVNGEPQFPLGLYSAGRFPEMAQAGFSFSHSYQTTTGEADDAINPTDIQLKELLDRNAEVGLKMMVELPRKAIEKGKWEQIRRRIETFRNHPGLGFWGSEERVARGEGPLKNDAAVYRIVKEMDPNHPFVLGDTWNVITKVDREHGLFFPDGMMDVGIWWYYPIPMEPDPEQPKPKKVSDLTFEPPNWLTNYTGNKPLWIAIQCYKHPRIDGRYPTRAEYRNMCYMPIVNGAKGVAFYTGSGQLDYNKKPSGILNNPEQGDWEYVKQLIREMRDLDPVLTAPAVTGKVVETPADAPVDFIVKDNAGKLTVIAANRAKRTIKMRFAGPGITGSQITVHSENRTVPVKGGAFTDTFGPYAVHIYMIGG